MSVRESPSHGSSGSYDVQDAERRDRAAAAHRVMVNSPAVPPAPLRIPSRWMRRQLATERPESGSTPASDVFEPDKSSGKKTRFQMTPHPITGQHLIIPPGRTRSSSRATPRAPGQDPDVDQPSPAPAPPPAGTGVGAGAGAEPDQRRRRCCCAGLVMVSVLLAVALCVGILASRINNDGSNFSNSASSANLSADSNTTLSPTDAPSIVTTVLPSTADFSKQPTLSSTSAEAGDPAVSEAATEPGIQARKGGGSEPEEIFTAGTGSAAVKESSPVLEAETDTTIAEAKEALPTSKWQDSMTPIGLSNGDSDIDASPEQQLSSLPTNQSPAPSPSTNQGAEQDATINEDREEFQQTVNPFPGFQPGTDQDSKLKSAANQGEPIRLGTAARPAEESPSRRPDDMLAGSQFSEGFTPSGPRPHVDSYALVADNRDQYDATTERHVMYDVIPLNATASPAAGAYRTVRQTLPGGDLDLASRQASALGSRPGLDLGPEAVAAALKVRSVGWEEFYRPQWMPKKLQEPEWYAAPRVDSGHRAASCFGPRSMVCPRPADQSGPEDHSLPDELCAVRCDSVVECPDLADERGCACADRLSPNLQCDGYFDCPDESDEMSCAGCAEGEFSCSSLPHLGGGRCVPRHQRCDGVEHCDNGRDERACLHLSDDVTPLKVYPLVTSHGFLHRLVSGDWMPVCHTGVEVARVAGEVCEAIVGRFTVGVAVASARTISSDYAGPFAVLSGSFSTTPECRSGTAVYVRCPPPACGHSAQELTSGREIRRRPRSQPSALVAALLADRSALTFDATNWDLENPLPTAASLPPFPSPLPTDEVELLENYPFHHQPGLHDSAHRRLLGPEHDGRIVGGARSAPGRHPWLCAIYRDGVFSCGGTVLTERWILSAAHCFERFEKYRYEIQAGMLRRQSFAPYEQSRLVTHVIVHPDYNRRIYAHDLALVRVSRPMVLTQWVAPICLPGPEEPLLAPGSQCTVVGWGQTQQDGPEVDDLMEVQIPVLSFCPEHYDNVTIQICAGPLRGGKDSCQGDSGGPLLCRSPDGHWKQYGIVSHGRGCALPNSPGVYTRISYFLPWISRIIAVDTVGSNKFPVQQCTTRLCRLRGGMCLTEAQMCDKQVDCHELEDERFCGPNGDEILPVNSLTTTTTTTPKPEPPPPSFDRPVRPSLNGTGCSDDEFQCIGVSQCIPASQRCDTRPQCADYSDEASCSLLEYLAKHQPDRVCDRHVDLMDAADEEHCCPPDSDHFYCPYSHRSIPLKWCCDRQADCEYGEDEANCVALVNPQSGTVDLDRESRPLLRRTGVVAIKSDYSTGATWTPICTESRSWIRRYSDVICNYLHQGSTVRERHIPVDAGILQPHYPLGAPLYQCGRGQEGDSTLRDEGRHHGSDESNFRDEGRHLGLTSENGTVMFEDGPLMFEDDGLMFDDDVLMFGDESSEFGGFEFGDDGLMAKTGDGSFRSRRELKTARLDMFRAHPVLSLQLLDYIRPSGRSSCTGVQLTCGDPEPACGYRPALKQLRNLAGPSSGRGVLPWHATVYVNGVEVSGATLISPSWVLLSPEVLVGISPSTDYVSVRAGQFRRQLFTVAAHNTSRVDFQSRDGHVTLLHLSRPLALGEDVYPACLPAGEGSGTHSLDDHQRCLAVGWDGERVTSVELTIQEACPEGRLCTLPSGTASCKTEGAWSGAIVCQSSDRLWRAVAVFLERGPHCFRRPGSWPRLSPEYLERQLSCMNISLTAPPQIEGFFREELLDGCPPAVAMSKPPCTGHRCELGQCLHPTQVCNGVPECDDGSDEFDCDFNVTSCDFRGGQCECAEDQIQCAEDATCWHYRAFCDGRAGCLSGADEPDVCTCRGFLWLAAPELICDQKMDCKTGDDELDCRYEAHQFRCYRDATVHLVARSQVCDGTYQCAGGEDEEHCLCLRETLPELMVDSSGKLSFNVTESRLGAPQCDASGHLMVRVLGRWVAVPKAMWNEEKSRRVCAKLGYPEMTKSEMRPMHGDHGHKSAIYISCE